MKWTIKRLSDLGKFTDPQLAKKWGVNVQSVYRKRRELGISPIPRYITLSPQIVERLGKQSDRSLAKECGVSYGKIQIERKKLNIPPFKEQKRIALTKEMLDYLGKITDKEFSIRYGINVTAVRRKRVVLNILAKCKRGRRSSIKGKFSGKSGSPMKRHVKPLNGKFLH